MTRVLTHFTDYDGNEYVVLDDPDDDDDDLRNAPPSRAQPARAQSVPTPRNPRAVPVRSAPRTRQPQAKPVQLVKTNDTMAAKTAKVLDFVEVFTDGVAELIPLPDKPPPPTGEVATDMFNQNEHRQALHAHRVLTSRIKTSGRVLSKVFRLLMDE